MTMQEWISGMRQRGYVGVVFGSAILCATAILVELGNNWIGFVFAAMGGVMIGQGVTTLIWSRVEQRRFDRREAA